MKIGNIEFGPQPLFLAPMEDVTDIGFRHLCKRFGASMVYTEFVSAEALVRSVNATLRKLHISDEERFPVLNRCICPQPRSSNAGHRETCRRYWPPAAAAAY